MNYGQLMCPINLFESIENINVHNLLEFLQWSHELNHHESNEHFSEHEIALFGMRIVFCCDYGALNRVKSHELEVLEELVERERVRINSCF